LATSIDDYRWLVSDVARPWLALAREAVDSHAQFGEVLVRLTSQLRKDLNSERTHLVIEQIELRQRAREKFSLADQMFFTPKGLQQATDEQLASYKASRFPAQQPIVDLCCGIGGDLTAFAQRGPARGVERDSATALLAATNAAVNGCSQSQCRVTVEDAVRFSVVDFAWHCDPDRRKEGRRATRGDRFDPPLEALDALLAQNEAAAVKLAPATEVPLAWRQCAELEWLSSRGECRQQVAWFGRLAHHPGRHAATVIGRAGKQRTVVGKAAEAVPQATAIDRYIYEADAAIIAAKLSAVLCLEHSLAAVSAGVSYFTSDALIDDLVLDRFEVVDVLPFDRKQLRGYCRERGISRLEIKKRGVDLSPERLRKEIASQGDQAATMIITPVQKQIRVIIARRIGD